MVVDNYSTDEILFAAEPPLLRSVARRLQRVIECALESPLTEEQRTIFEAQLIKEWQAGKEAQEAINETMREFDSVVEQISGLVAAKQVLAWREFSRQLYIYAQREGKEHPLAQLILQTYESKHELLIKGSPPLSQQAAESYGEMISFFQSVITRTSQTLNTREKEEIIQSLVSQFPGLSREIKEQISQADIFWGVIRYNWQQANRDEREQFRQELLRLAQLPDHPLPKTEVREAGSMASTSNATLALARNNRLMEAMKKLRMSASKNTPFKLRKG
jgi:hypothetical protein